MLKFNLSGQELTYLDKGEVIVGGTVNYLEAEFEFDEAWSGYQTITAYFKNGAALHCMDITDGRIVPDDGLNLEPGMWDVYIRAVSYDDGGDEIAKQITSTTVRINALSHGRFGGSDFPSKPTPIYEQKYAEIVVAEAKRVEAENARNVFEEYSSGKTYVKGNKVSYEGSSYVLMADSSKGINPTDKGSWLCIAEKGDKGEQGVQGVKGEKGDKGDKGVTGGKIFSYALGYGKNVEVGSYISVMPPYELINEGIDYGDIIVDTDGGCIFQYVAQLGGDGDDDAVLPVNGLHCIANPNGEKGDKGDKGKDGVDGKDGKDGKSGAKIYPVPFESRLEYGKDEEIQFDFNHTHSREDYPNADDWAVGDVFITPNRKILIIANIQKVNSELFNVIVVCVFDGDAVPEGKYADIYLNNVSNEAFKAKAEEAGVGGDNAELLGDAPMVFKGVVSELPETANENDVYALSTWEKVGVFNNVNNMTLIKNNINFSEWNDLANFIYADVQSNYGCSYKFVINGNGYVYADCGINSASEEGFDMLGHTDDVETYINVPNESKVDVYRLPVGVQATNKLYIYYGGEWVETSKDGVTKAEMESYVEETLLGGEW